MHPTPGIDALVRAVAALVGNRLPEDEERHDAERIPEAHDEHEERHE